MSRIVSAVRRPDCGTVGIDGLVRRRSVMRNSDMSICRGFIPVSADSSISRSHLTVMLVDRYADFAEVQAESVHTADDHGRIIWRR